MMYYRFDARTTDPRVHAALMERARELACLHLNLCAQVGCGCCVEGADVVCSERQMEGVSTSEGPAWTLTVRGLPDGVDISLVTHERVTQDEEVALYKALSDLGAAVFRTRQNR